MSFLSTDSRLKVLAALFLILGVFPQSINGIKCYKCEGKIKYCNKFGTVTCPEGSYCYKQAWEKGVWKDHVKRGCFSRELGECLERDANKKCQSVYNTGWYSSFKKLQEEVVNKCTGESGYASWADSKDFPFHLCWCDTDRCNVAGQSIPNYKFIFGVLTIVASYNYGRGMTCC